MVRKQKRIETTFRSAREGISQVLGELEAAIMETLWALGQPATVTEVQRAMEAEARAYHTVATVLVRLCKKGLVARRKRSDVWHYGPTLTREAFHDEVARQVITGVYGLAPEAAVNSMLDLVDANDPAGLDELERLIAKKKRERGG